MVAAVETMAYSGEVPWHSLGTRVLPDLTPDQMLEKAGLNWTVSKSPLTYMYKGDHYDSQRQALVRDSDGKLLDVVSDGWMPLQNEQAFEFFEEFVAEGDMEMHTAGSLMGGQMVWALAKVKESFEVVSGDQVDSYMLFTNPHCWGRAINVRFTPIRVVCWNTLSLALQENADRAVRVNHRNEFDAAQVKETLGIASNKFNEYKEAAQLLTKKRYTDESLSEYFSAVFPKLGKKNGQMSRKANRALELVDQQPGAQYGEGSWWSAFNAVTYLTDHEAGRSTDSRLTSAWYGANRQTKVKALNLALQLAA